MMAVVTIQHQHHCHVVSRTALVLVMQAMHAAELLRLGMPYKDVKDLTDDEAKATIAAVKDLNDTPNSSPAKKPCTPSK